MPVRSQTVNVQAFNLEGLVVFAAKHEGYLMLRNLGGLVLENTGEEDSHEERIVPGVLVEGVSSVRASFEGDDSVKVTVWAGGSMHEIVSSPDAEVEARVCNSTEARPFPELEVCGRCNRHELPGHEHGAGC